MGHRIPQVLQNRKLSLAHRGRIRQRDKLLQRKLRDLKYVKDLTCYCWLWKVASDVNHTEAPGSSGQHPSDSGKGWGSQSWNPKACNLTNNLKEFGGEFNIPRAFLIEHSPSTAWLWSWRQSRIPLWVMPHPDLGVENGNGLQYSCLKISMDRWAWWATVHGAAKSHIWLSTHICLYTYIIYTTGSKIISGCYIKAT